MAAGMAGTRGVWGASWALSPSPVPSDAVSREMVSEPLNCRTPSCSHHCLGGRGSPTRLVSLRVNYSECCKWCKGKEKLCPLHSI